MMWEDQLGQKEICEEGEDPEKTKYVAWMYYDKSIYVLKP